MPIKNKLLVWARSDLDSELITNPTNPTFLIVIGQIGSGLVENIKDYESLAFLQTKINNIDYSNCKIKYITYRDLINLSELVYFYKNKGFSVYCLVLNTSDKASWLCVLEKFGTSVSDFLKSEHDNYYDLIPSAVRKIYDSKIIDFIKIVDDSDNTIFSDFLFFNKKKSIKIWKRNNKNPAGPILDYRSKPLSLAQVADYQKRWAFVLTKFGTQEAFKHQINYCRFNNELKFFNVADKLCSSLTYKSFFNGLLEKYVLNLHIKNELKLDRINDIYFLADQLIKNDVCNQKK